MKRGAFESAAQHWIEHMQVTRHAGPSPQHPCGICFWLMLHGDYWAS